MTNDGLFSNSSKNKLIWAYQDFDAGEISSTTFNLTSNNNGSNAKFAASKIVSNRAAVFKASSPESYVYSGTTKLFSSKVMVVSQTIDSIQLSAIPHPTWGIVRIWYQFNSDKIPNNYSVPSFQMSAKMLNELDPLLVTQDEVIDNLNSTDATKVLSANQGRILKNSIDVDLQQAYIKDPEIITDATNGAVSIQGGTGTDTDSNIEIKNNAGVVTAKIQADGEVEGTKITASSSINTVIPTHFATNDASNSVAFGINGSLAANANKGFLWHYNNFDFRFGTNNIERAVLKNTGELKLNNLTASCILSADPNQNIISLNTGTYPNLTELSYVKNVTSPIQAQLTSKEPAFTKNTAFNKDFGIAVGEVCQGDSPALLAGRAGGQAITGGTAASENLEFNTTSHATKGNFLFNDGDLHLKRDKALFKTENAVALREYAIGTDRYVRLSHINFDEDSLGGGQGNKFNALISPLGSLTLNSVAGTNLVLAREAVSRITIGDNTTINSDLNITGDLILTGNVDGRDIEADGTKLDGIADNANNYALPVASASLGGVKSGADITIDGSGNVSVNDDSHNHVISNIDGLQTELDGKVDDSQVLTDVPSGAVFTDVLAGLSPANNYFVVGNGSSWTAESPSSARTSLGLGSLATKSNINNADWFGTDLAVANGGTGASTDWEARNNLGLSIGSDVQAYDANLTQLAGLTPTDSNIIVGNGSAWVAESGSTARASLGLGSLATANNINNSNWSGDDLTVVNGGTGASTSAGARSNLGLGSLAILNNVSNNNWSGTDLAVTNGGTGSSTSSGARSNLGLGTSNSVTFGGLSVADNTDISAIIGRARIGYFGASDWAGFGHRDKTSSSDYAVLQNSVGRTLVNCSPGQNMEFRQGNLTKMFINSQGNFYVNNSAYKPGGGSWGNYSDRRLKKNIANLDGGLDKICKLNPVTYEWKDKRRGEGEQIGFIAQSVQKNFPKWIGQEDGHLTLTLPFDFDALVVGAIKELKAEITNLKEQINA